jgi:putative ABC transport system permease protein
MLKPSNTPGDRVIWIPLAGIQTMSGHDPNAATDVSAVLVKLQIRAVALAGFQLDLLYNKQGNRLTFAWPIGAVLADLFDKLGWFDRVLTLVSYLVALVAAGSILASIYNSMSERRRELAILRASRARGAATVFSAIVLESAPRIAALGVLGAVLRFTLGC